MEKRLKGQVGISTELRPEACGLGRHRGWEEHHALGGPEAPAAQKAQVCGGWVAGGEC